MQKTTQTDDSGLQSSQNSCTSLISIADTIELIQRRLHLLVFVWSDHNRHFFDKPPDSETTKKRTSLPPKCNQINYVKLRAGEPCRIIHTPANSSDSAELL